METKRARSFPVDIINAQHRISPYITRTVLLESPVLQKTTQHAFPVYLKCEGPPQVTGSFKIRGAFNKLLQLSDTDKKRGVVLRSSGNFAAAVAYASTKLGIDAKIFMPTIAPKSKVANVKASGITPTLHGSEHWETQALVDECAAKEGRIILSSYNDMAIIHGQGTLAIEAFEDRPDIAHFIVPVGGGGVISGVALVARTQNNCRVTGAEPDCINKLQESIKANDRVTLTPPFKTSADGLKAPALGDLNWSILKSDIDAVSVSETEIASAQHLILNEHNLLIEPSCAVAVAAFLKADIRANGPVCIVITGGNVDAPL